MGKGGGHAPDPYVASSAAPANAGGYNPASWTGHSFGNGQPHPMPPSVTPGMPGGFGGAQFPPPQNPLYGQPNPSAGLPSQSMGMNPYRPDNDPYARQQDRFADKAEDKPWKFGPAPGGGFMRLQDAPDQARPPQLMQPPMVPQPPMQGHGFGNEQQQPAPIMQPGAAGGQPAPAYPNHWNVR